MNQLPTIDPNIFTHVRTIISIIVGLSIGRLLTGLARFVQHPRQQKIYPVHLVWTFFMLVYVIHFWWWEFRLAGVQWTFVLYCFAAFYASVFFFLCTMLFPDTMYEYKGFADYFMSRRRWFFGILIGTFLAGHQRYREWLAVFYFIHLLFSSAAVAITYKGLLDPNFGLGAGLGIPLLQQDWLGEGRLAMGVLIFIVSWQFVPFHSLLYQGAIRQIPRSLYEAAQLDGAGRVRQFWSITLPTLRYTIVTSSTLMVVGSLTFFDLIWILTAGGPGDSTRVLALDMYIRGFRGNQMGPASVIAVILVLIGLGLSLLFRRIGGGSASDSQLEGA
jgi:ABC-type glycerol-3-phosphate transport system permease component